MPCLSANQQNQAIVMLQAGAMVNDLHNITDALIRLSITSMPGLQSMVPSTIVRVLVNVM